MSQFDFPRINFSGKAFINPGTANNNILLPLVMYDPIQVKVVLPPRIYLTPDQLCLHKLGGLPVPAGQDIRYDAQQLPYIEIEPIRTREECIEWAKTPLGSSPLDQLYHELYQMVLSKRTQKPLHGTIPAGWNFYGGMEFGFRDVQVRSVTIPDAQGGPQVITPEMPKTPADIAELLGATLDMADERGRDAAVIIDVVPSLAMFSQVFCDRMRLHKSGVSAMQGKPRKASLRFLNLDRIINIDGVLASSGTFFTVIPLTGLEGGEASPIMDFFRKYGRGSKPLKGVFIRYNLFEVEENQEPDYTALGSTANPARASVAGSISPWYEGDPESITTGRHLLPDQPFIGARKLSNLVCRVDTERQHIAIDLLGSIPEMQLPDGSFDTYALGSLHLQLQSDDGTLTRLGAFPVHPEQYSREQWLTSSGIVDIPFPDAGAPTPEQWEQGTMLLSVSSENDPSRETVLLREDSWMIFSEQAGLYADEGQALTDGYRSHSPEKEQCLVQVYHRGRPFTGRLPMTVMELKITAPGASATISTFLETDAFENGQPLHFPCNQAANAMYVFFPGPDLHIPGDLISEIIRSGRFVSLRVLPQHDYGKYLDVRHADYPTPVSFEVLYQESLRVYDHIFPVSSLITPFTEAYFSKGWRFIQHRMAPGNWDSASYMPSGRDLSPDQWALFCKWLEQFDNPKTEP